MNYSRRVVRRLRSLASLLVLGACCGCVRTTVRSGLAPGNTPLGWQDRWHHGFAFGLDEVPDGVELDRLCPEGWSRVDTAIDPVQGVIAILTLGIYTPSMVSVVCADPSIRRGRGTAGTWMVPASLTW